MADGMQSLGTRIRRARERAQLSQEQLAKAVGASVRAVGDWENDRRRPRNRLGAVEAALNVDLTSTPGPEPELVARDQWEADVLADPDLPAAVKRQLIGDYRAVRDAYRSARHARRAADPYRPTGTAG